LKLGRYYSLSTNLIAGDVILLTLNCNLFFLFNILCFIWLSCSSKCDSVPLWCTLTWKVLNVSQCFALPLQFSRVMQMKSVFFLIWWGQKGAYKIKEGWCNKGLTPTLLKFELSVLTCSLLEPSGPCTESMEISESCSEWVNIIYTH